MGDFNTGPKPISEPLKSVYLTTSLVMGDMIHVFDPAGSTQRAISVSVSPPILYISTQIFLLTQPQKTNLQSTISSSYKIHTNDGMPEWIRVKNCMPIVCQPSCVCCVSEWRLAAWRFAVIQFHCSPIFDCMRDRFFEWACCCLEIARLSRVWVWLWIDPKLACVCHCVCCWYCVCVNNPCERIRERFMMMMMIESQHED